MRHKYKIILAVIIIEFLFHFDSYAQFDDYDIFYSSQLPFHAYSYQQARGWADFISEHSGFELFVSNQYEEMGYYMYENAIYDSSGSKIDLPIGDILMTSFKVIDYDSDGDIDLFTCGSNGPGNIQQTMLLNNINGTFYPVNTTFMNFSEASNDWNDFDHDGDYDLLISGYNKNYGLVTKIYRNDIGSFKDILTSLDYTGTVKWLDLDNDNRIELIIDKHIFYIDANNNLVLIDTLPVNEVIPKNYLDIADFDMDGDVDFVFGSKIIQNNNNVFTLYAELPSGGGYDHINSWGDIDNDGDLDLFHGSKIYRNDSINGFSLINYTFDVVSTWIDYDSDNDLDINTPSRIYKNNSPTPNHLPLPPKNLQLEVIKDSIKFSWTSGSDQETDSSGLTYNMYIGSCPECCDIMSPMSNVSDGKRLILSQGNLFQSHTYYIKNLPEGEYYWGVQSIDNCFSPSTFAHGSKFWISKFNFLDITSCGSFNVNLSILFDSDNDNDLDILTFNSGHIFDSPFFRGMCLNGNEIYSGRPYESYGDRHIVDYNRDGLLDVMLDIYRFDNKDTSYSCVFTPPDSFSNFNTDNYSQIFGIDFNNDRRWDSISGDTLFVKTDRGFILHSIIPGLARSASWCDYDNDGDLDLAAGNKIYRNDKVNFTLTDITLSINPGDAIYWADFDNNGYPDILFYTIIPLSAYIFYNEGHDKFIPYELQIPTANSTRRSFDMAVGDMNNDLNIDIVSIGMGYYFNDSYNFEITNNINVQNTRPTSPENLSNILTGFNMLLKWSPATDIENKYGGLTYNIRVGTTLGGIDILSPMSDPVTGYRRVPWIGNVGTNLGWILEDLGEGTYYWSVQAIDHSLTGGPWAPEQSFTISRVSANFTSDTVCEGSMTSFNDFSLASNNKVTAWKWYFGDGDSSDMQNPKHLYPEGGIYNATLIAYTDSFNHSVTRPVLVRQRPKADFSIQLVCENSKSVFTDLSNTDSITIAKWRWDFGYKNYGSNTQGSVNYTYPEPGNYNAKLSITATNGCVDSISRVSIVEEYPNLPLTLRSGYTPAFCEGKNAVLEVADHADYTYRWMIDGVYEAGTLDTLVVNQTAVYSVEVTNTLGNCVDTTNSIPITVHPTPSLLNITSSINPAEICLGDSIKLSIPYIPGYTYEWKYSNGGSTGEFRNEMYAKEPGTYYVDVRNAEGCETASANMITVIVHEAPSISTLSTNGPTSFCEGGSVRLYVQDIEGLSYHWKKDGYDLPSANTFEYTASESGNYSLEITNLNGCKARTDAVTVQKIINPIPPLITAQSDTIFCAGDSVILSTTPDARYKYSWIKDNADQYSHSPVFTARNSGIYWLNIEITGAEKCSQASSNHITVQVKSLPEKPLITADRSSVLCEGDILILSIEETPGINCQWTRDDIPVTGANEFEFETTSEGNYKAEVTNTEGCNSPSVNTISVMVLPRPDIPEIITDYDTVICPGERITLRVQDPSNIYDYQWLKNGQLQLIGTEYSGKLEAAEYSVRAGIGSCMEESRRQTITWKSAPEKPEIIVRGPVIWYLACTITDAESYKWFYNGNLIEGANKYIYVANKQLGRYSVEIEEEGYECPVMSDEKTIPDYSTDLDDLGSESEIIIYPNPNNGTFTLMISNLYLGEIGMKVYTLTGSVVMIDILEKNQYLNEYEFYWEKIEGGVYLIELKFDQKKEIRRLLKY
jgi:hypothetical protein